MRPHKAVSYNPNNGNYREQKGIQVGNLRSSSRIQVRRYHNPGSLN